MVLGIRYLTGHAVAKDVSRQRAEWPPHPARIYMAMAAAHFETGTDAQERAALEWLESEPAPALFADEAAHRSPVESYVPVNDEHGGILRRSKQPRTLPVVRPDSDCVYLFWNSDPEQGVRDALARLCEKVTRIGHSSSLAQMWLPDSKVDAEPNWIPAGQEAVERLRVAEKGLLRYLERSFNGGAITEYFRLEEELAEAKGGRRAILRNQMRERFGGAIPEVTRPVVTSWSGYRRVKKEAGEPKLEAYGPFDGDFIVLNKLEGAVLGLESTLQLTSALRNAALKAAPEPAPEWLSGHAEDGSASRQPHVAFFPLPYVGWQHSDGHVVGMGIALPREFNGKPLKSEAAGLRRYLGPLLFDPDGNAKSIRLWRTRKEEGSKVWEWELEQEAREAPPRTVRRETWVGPHTVWASVTPVVLHHYPKKNRLEDVERIVREAFRSALLPEPERVEISSVSAHAGAGHATKSMPLFDEGGLGMTRYQTHVTARFRETITGPMLVGRGRFRGYGLFRPLEGGRKT